MTFLKVKFPKNQNSNPPKLLKWKFLTLWRQSKLISHKIRKPWKWLNFQVAQYPQSKFPIRLVRSVQKWLKSRLDNLFFWQHWWTTILNWSNWEKSKSTCIHKSKQILYMCKHNLLIHERTLSSNQLSFEVRQCYQIKRWLEFDFR